MARNECRHCPACWSAPCQPGHQTNTLTIFDQVLVSLATTQTHWQFLIRSLSAWPPHKHWNSDTFWSGPCQPGHHTNTFTIFDQVLVSLATTQTLKQWYILISSLSAWPPHKHTDNLWPAPCQPGHYTNSLIITSTLVTFTLANISGLSSGRIQDSVFTFGCPRMDVSPTQSYS